MNSRIYAILAISILLVFPFDAKASNGDYFSNVPLQDLIDGVVSEELILGNNYQMSQAAIASSCKSGYTKCDCGVSWICCDSSKYKCAKCDTGIASCVGK